MSNRSITFEATCEADTQRLGAALADALPEGTTVALLGTLGAGKTRLVQAVAEALGVAADDVTSPTFVLQQIYQGRHTIYHLDAYRLADEDEFLALGVDELFDSAALVFVEWADRVAACLPRQYVEIRITPTGDTSRRFEISAQGAEYEPVIAAIEATTPT